MRRRQPILEGRGLVKRFGAVTALDGVDLAIEPGEFFSLLGPSGCGKTTLLRVFAGFEVPDAGVVRLEGMDITGLHPSKRPLNMMFQSYALFPHMTVARNIAYGLEMDRLPAADIARRVGEIIDVTGLGGLADRRPHELSGGQRQRVALARALVKRPRVLLLDEPLSALDKGLREQMQVELKRSQRDAGIAFIIVTHDQEEALGLADRVAVLDRGRICQIGTPKQIYDAPADRFVARFVGSNNVIEAPLKAKWLPKALRPLLAEPGSCLAIRPERLVLARKPEELRQLVSFDGTVTDTVFHGPELLAVVRAREGRMQVTARIGAADAERLKLDVGQTVWCGFAAEHARRIAPDRTTAAASAEASHDAGTGEPA